LVFDLKTIQINGEVHKLKTGKKDLPFRGSLDLEGNKITISTGTGEEVDFISYSNYYYNAYVRTNLLDSHLKGVCSHQFLKSYYFDHPKQPKRELH